MSETRFVHTSIVARNWARLAEFYEDVFGCVRVPPERNQSGEMLAKGTGVSAVSIRGVHLRLPGCGENGPTLEIYTYSPELEAEIPMPNRPGLGHVAFRVSDVQETYARILAEGGSKLGEPVQIDVQGAGTINFVYVRDPEGNIIELQRWM